MQRTTTAKHGPSAWSRFWGAAAACAFWLSLGAALYEAAVLAPQWVSSAADLRAWNQSGVRPEPARLMTPLAALAVGATLLAWLSSLGIRSSRRWWLTLALACASGLAWAVVMGLIPAERGLRGASLTDAQIAELTNEWVRWSAARLLVLLLGAYAAYRGHVARIFGAAVTITEARDMRRGASRDFVLSDEDPDAITLGDD
ncbi:MAG TPA: hypothetical protein VEC57_13475 [Candidatus Limnocylindrales bacterium]|nr:hypothetical protein [Candidatus Limnocylindrales bacterium]